MWAESLASDLAAFASVVVIDLVLAGDNAIVVGLAAQGLPAEQRWRVIALGVGAAVVFRVAFALVATQLITVVGLALAGGLLLLWVAWKLWRELRREAVAARAPGAGAAAAMGAASPPIAEEAGCAAAPPKTLGMAIWQIMAADLSMSLDNVLGVAGAARDHPWMLVFGLVLSVALMGVAAGCIARIMARHHWITYLGLGIILYIALAMIYSGGCDLIDALAA